jgi:hypothetical protein
MDDDDNSEREEQAIYLIVIVVLAPVVLVTAIYHRIFDGGSSLCLLAVVLGAIGLAATRWRARRARRLPRAEIRTRRSPGTIPTRS